MLNSPYAKAIVAALVPLVGVLASWYLTGELNSEELAIAIVGVLTAAGVYAQPNKAKGGGSRRLAR